MARLPIPGKDSGAWGDILNDYLSQAHKSDGALKDNVVTNGVIAPDAITAAEIQNGSITEALLSSGVQTKLNQTAPTWSTLSGRPVVVAAGADQATARTAIGAGTVQDADIAVNVLKEGVAGNGSTNDRAAIQTVINTYAGQRSLRFPKGRYRIGVSGVTSGFNRITLPSGTHIIADPGAIFEINQMDYQSGTTIFYAGGTDGVKVNMTTNTIAGSQTLALPTGQGAGFVYGDLVGIESTGSAGGSSEGPFYVREIRRVMKVSGDTLNLDTPLEYAYNTADTAQFWKIVPVRDIVLEGMRFEPGPGVTPGTDGTYPIKLMKSLNCRLENIELHNMIGGVVLHDAYDTLVEGLNVDGLPRFTDSFGYGLLAAGSTTNLIIDGLRGRENRHLFTTIADQRGTSPSYTFWGGPMHVQINDGIGYGGVESYSVWDTHEFGRHIHFNNCIAIGGGSLVTGFQMRAQDIQLNNCRAIRCGIRGAVAQVNSKNVQIIGGEYAYNGSSGIGLYGADGHVVGARIHHNGASGVAINGNTSVDCRIADCSIYENTNYGIQDSGASGSIRSIIQGCYVPQSAAQTLAVVQPSATSTVTGCIFTGYGSNQHGINAPVSGSRISNILTDSGVVGNMTIGVGSPSQPSPSYNEVLFRHGFGMIRTDASLRV